MKPEAQALLLTSLALAAAGADRPVRAYSVPKMKSMDPGYRTGNRSRKAKRKAQKAARRRNR